MGSMPLVKAGWRLARPRGANREDIDIIKSSWATGLTVVPFPPMDRHGLCDNWNFTQTRPGEVCTASCDDGGRFGFQLMARTAGWPTGQSAT